MTKLEEVARAIWEAECKPCGDDVQAWQLMVARAAVSAMRDPTIDQIAIGWQTLRREKTPVQLLGRGSGLKEAYTAMLDAILNEEQPK
jgi:hypothetical protein